MAELTALDLASRSRPVSTKPKNFKQAPPKPKAKAEPKDKATADKERRAKLYNHPRSETTRHG